MSRPPEGNPFELFTITSPVSTSKKKNASWFGTYKWWAKSMRRLSVFADTHASPGEVVNGQIDKLTRLVNYKTFKHFMDKYDGIDIEANRPFSANQEAEILRILAGGLLAG